MKTFLVVFLLGLSASVLANHKQSQVELKASKKSPFDLQLAKQRCAPPKAGELYVVNSDFDWGQSRQQMAERFDRLYRSEKRLSKRVYFEPTKNAFVFPSDNHGAEDFVEAEPHLLKSITRHVERGLELGYAEHVFMSDMGHSHIHIPQKYYDEVVAPIDGMANTMRAIFKNQDIRILYHTAEQLTMLGADKKPLPDRHLQWRIYTRNMVGANRGDDQIDLLFEPTSAYNTARGEKGYRYWGSGFYIHASKNGCFPYLKNGKQMFFDLSLESLPPNASGFSFFDH